MASGAPRTNNCLWQTNLQLLTMFPSAAVSSSVRLKYTPRFSSVKTEQTSCSRNKSSHDPWIEVVYQSP